MPFTASKLRENIYRVLDEILATGVPVEITRKGRRLKIVPVDEPDKLANLKQRDVLKGDPEDIVHLDWSGEWQG
ncbi:MAG: prevent-host-death family protein [Planctomycetota bacterium]|jgi:prevent-host-death family protein